MTTTVKTATISKPSEIEFDESSLAKLQEQAQGLTLPEESAGRVFPAIQLSNYQPRDGEEVFWCFSDDMLQRLNVGLWIDAGVKFNPISCYFYRTQSKPVKANHVEADLRLIPLWIPSKFVQDKKEHKILNPEKGMDFTNKVTVAKLFLAVIANGKFLCSEDGIPEIITLKLRSFNTQVIGASDNDEGSLRRLSAQLRAKRLRICHCNLKISVEPVERVSKVKAGESSPSVKFVLSGAKPNSPDIMEKLIPVLNDTEFQSYLKDPFRINQDKPVQTVQPEQELTEEELESMPF